MSDILNSEFFRRNTLEVAEDLLGHFLVREIGGETNKLIIKEVEAYVGPEDKASHASKGKTKRNEMMFEKPGTLYVYLIYGMYWMLNVVTEKKGHPSAVLIRGVGDYGGPGILTRELEIDGELDGEIARPDLGLWFEKNKNKKDDEFEIDRTPRIGIDYAEEWADKPFRFLLKD